MNTFKPTRKGDSGATTLNKKRIPKSSVFIQLLGKIDTLQAHIGDSHRMLTKKILKDSKKERMANPSFLSMIMFRDETKDQLATQCEISKCIKLSNFMVKLMEHLYELSCILNGYGGRDDGSMIGEIDKMIEELPFKQYSKFIIPIFISEITSKFNLLRATVRELELFCIDNIFLNNEMQIEFSDATWVLFDKQLLTDLANANMQSYFNRLSSLFYAMMCYYEDDLTVIGRLVIEENRVQ
jgi:ethanolamine utilization cobalamin adenosyltransferase